MPAIMNIQATFNLPNSFIHAQVYVVTYDFYFSLGIDGYFSDFPRTARQYLDWKRESAVKLEL